MPRNVEIKARLTDVPQAVAIAAKLSGAPPGHIQQHDVFFQSRQGRLKLRMFPDGSGELIQYDRPDTVASRLSDYRIATTPDAEVLLDILSRTGTVIGEVRKDRVLYVVGQTRVHIDRVQGLGDFMELEVVLRPDQDPDEGTRIADKLLQAFHIDQAQIVGGAYVDLLTARNAGVTPIAFAPAAPQQ